MIPTNGANINHTFCETFPAFLSLTYSLSICMPSALSLVNWRGRWKDRKCFIVPFGVDENNCSMIINDFRYW